MNKQSIKYKLRGHQVAFSNICDEIINNENIDTIYANVFPGCGKSYLPVIASKLLDGKYNLLVWVVPRLNLLYQGYADYILHDTNHSITLGKWETDSQKETVHTTDVLIITYHALTSSRHEEYYNLVASRNTILFLDEPHHLGENKNWGCKLLRFIDSSKLRIFASGTFKRGDSKKITGIEYTHKGKPVFDTLNSRYIQYTREDGESEKAIVPIDIKAFNYRSAWQEENTNFIETSGGIKGTRKSLFTALKTEYAYELLNVGFNDWQTYKSLFSTNAKLLIVAANIKLAKEYYSYIKKQSINCRIATSHNSKLAIDNIKHYKESNYMNVLITVAMAYEGMSVNNVTHIICLTHIRSIPWLIQLFSRGNRTFPGKKKAFIYGPGDRFFVDAKNAYLSGLDLDIKVVEKTVNENSRSKRRKRKAEAFKPLYSQILQEENITNLAKLINDPANANKYITATQVMHLLGIAKSTFSYRLKAYGVEPSIGYFDGKRERIIKVEEYLKIAHQKVQYKVNTNPSNIEWSSKFIEINTIVKTLGTLDDWQGYFRKYVRKTRKLVIDQIIKEDINISVFRLFMDRWTKDKLKDNRNIAIIYFIDFYSTFRIVNESRSTLFKKYGLQTFARQFC